MSLLPSPSPAGGTSAAAPPPAPPRRRFSRWLRGTALLALALAALWALYVLAANLALASETLVQRIQRRPDKLQIEWSSAWTWWPGRLSVEGLGIRGQSRRARWSAELDHVALWIDLPALAGRTFHVTGCEGRGVVFRYLGPAAPGETFAEDAGLAPIPPLAEPPPQPAAPGRSQRRAGRWTLHLEDISLREVRQVWVNRFRLDGPGRAGGSFSLTPGGGPLEVEGGFLDWPAADLSSGGQVLTRGLSLSAEMELDSFVPRETHGRRVFSYLSGDLGIAAEIESLDFLSDLVQAVPHFELQGGGALEARVLLEHGRLRPGSRLTVARGTVGTEILGFRIGGDGTVAGRVVEEDGETRLDLAVELEQMELTHGDGGTERVTASGLQVGIVAAWPDLVEGFPDPALFLDLPSLRLSDMRALNPYLPDGLGLRFTGGAADLGAHLEVSKSSVRGRIGLAGQGLKVAWKGRRGSADLAAELHLAQGDPEARWLDFTGSRIELDRLRLGGGSTESALGAPTRVSLEVESGSLMAAEPPTLDPPASGNAPGEPPSPLEGLDRASGHLALTGRLSDLAVLDPVLPTGDWLRLSGALELRSEIMLRGGALAPETSARFRSSRLGARFAGFAAEGRGTVWAALGGDGSGSRVTLALLDAELRREGDPAPLLRTPSLDLVATGPPAGPADPFAGRVQVDLPPTTVLDPVRLGQLLPPGLPFELRAGTATVGAHFELAGGTGRGRMRLDGRELAAVLRGQPLSGDLTLDLELAHGDLESRTFDLGGSRVELVDWVIGEGEDSRRLTADFAVRSGRLRWGEAEGGPGGEIRVPPGSLTLSGRISDVGCFTPLIQVGTWLGLTGEARVRSELLLDSGGLAPGSTVEVSSDRLSAALVGYRAVGLGTVRGRLRATRPAPVSEMTLELEELELFREGDLTPYLRSPRLVLEASGSDLSSGGLREDLEIRAVLAPSVLPDLTSLNVYLPPGGAFSLTSGQGALEGWVEVSHDHGEGRFELSAQRVEARAHGYELSTDLELEVPLTTDDPTSWAFDLDGSRLRLENTSVLGRPSDEPWWAEVTLPRASLRQTRPLELGGDVILSLQDTRPLVELLAQEKKLVRWVDQWLIIPDVHGTARVEMGSGGLRLDPVEIDGEHFELDARLHLGETLEEGLFYVRFHKLSIGLEVKDGRRDLDFLNAREWYDRHPGLTVPPP